MDAKDVIGLVRQNWLLLLVCAVLGAMLSGGASFLITPQYESRSQLFVAVKGGDSVTDLAQGNSFSERRVASYVALARSSEVLQDVIERTGTDLTVGQLRAMISASSPSQTVLIDVRVEHPNPALARKFADALALALIDAVTRVEGGAENSLVTMSVVEQATTPTDPVSPNITKNTAAGIGIGLLIGAVIAVLRKLLDTQVRSRETLAELTDIGVLGEIKAEPELEKNPLSVLTEPHGLRAESFRQLRAQLQFTNLRHGRQTLLVTSSTAGEGKSSTSINLALIMSESQGRVLLIDADLRRPRVADYLGLESAVGLSTVLSGRISARDAIQTVGAPGGLDVMAAGQIPPNPSELLGSNAMAELLTELGGIYETIIIDAPPVLPVADPTVLAGLVSGVMLVVSIDGRVHRDQLSETVEKLTKTNTRVVGITLNRAPWRGKAQEYRYEYVEQPAPKRRLRRPAAVEIKAEAAAPRRRSWVGANGGAR